MVGRGGDKAARQDLFRRRSPSGARSDASVCADRQRLVLRRRRASGVRAPASTRSASRRASSAVDRCVVRAARPRGDARREPDRPRCAPRVPRRVQRVRVGRERDRADGDAGVGLVVLARRRDGHDVARERPRHAPDPTAVHRALPRSADLPRRGPARLTLKIAPDRFTNLVRITADATSVDPLSVSFAVKRPGRMWSRIGTDDGAPYAVFVDPGDYRRRQAVSFVAVVRSSDGSVSASPVVTQRLRP